MLLILWIAAYMRFGAAGITEFKRDEATLSRLALDLVTGDHIPYLGIGSSVGFPNTPISVYLMALPYLLSANPLIATLFVGSLNWLAVAVVWKMTRRYFGRVAAAWGGLFYAVSPWAVIYSRKIWAQDLLPLFIVATIFLGILGFLEARPKRFAQLLFLPLLALTLQIHYGAITVVPVAGLILIFGYKNIAWRAVIISAFIAGIVCLPFLYGLYQADIRSWSSLRDSLNTSVTSDDSAEAPAIRPAILDYTWFTLAGKDIHALAGENQFLRYLDQVPDYPLFDLIPLVIGVGIGVLLLRLRQREERSFYAVLLVWFVVPILTYVYTWTAVHPHYLIPLLPIGFMLFGIGVARVQQIIPWRGAYLVGIGLFALAGIQSWMTLSLWNFLNEHNTQGAFGTPIHYLLDIRKAAIDQEPQSVVVVSNATSTQYDEEPAVWDVLLAPIAQVSFVDGTRLWIIPHPPSLYIATPNFSAESPFQTRLRAPDKIFPLRPDEGLYRLWYENPVALPETQYQASVRYQNGVILEGIWREGSMIGMVWRLPDQPPTAFYQVFVHGLSTEKPQDRLTQRDQPFLEGNSWQAQSRVIVYAGLELSAVQYLWVGMYSLTPAGMFDRNSAVVNDQGDYQGEGFLIALDEIPSISVSP